MRVHKHFFQKSKKLVVDDIKFTQNFIYNMLTSMQICLHTYIHICLLLYLQVKYHIKIVMLTLNSWDVQQFFSFVLVEMELS